MKLYHHPMSTFSQKAMIALEEKGLEYDPCVVQLMDPQGKEDYRKIYPMGKIPMLQLADDHIIPESSIIIEYLDEIAPPRLIPEDTQYARKTRFKDRMFDNYLNESVGTVFFQNLKPEEQRNHEAIADAQFRISVMYQFMDGELAKQTFACGDQFTMADCAAAAALFYCPTIAPFSDKPNIVRYWEQLKARPSIKAVHEKVAPHLAAFQAAQAN